MDYIVKITVCQPFPKRQIVDTSKLKEFADDNFKFDRKKKKKNGRKFSKRVENTVGKGEIMSNFSFFPQCFQKKKKKKCTSDT